MAGPQAQFRNANRIRELTIPGIRLITRPQRFYPKGSLAAHVIGIAGIDNQGLEGLEYYYDQFLKGTQEQFKWKEMLCSGEYREART